MSRKQLIRGLEKVKDYCPILLCFPYAGGAASAYRGWQEKIGEKAAVCAIQLPGREDRLTEEPYTSMEKLLDDLVARISYYRENPLYLFGHSMGAKIAAETARVLQDSGIRLAGLIVSASKTMNCPVEKPLSHLPKDMFIEELVKFNGIPGELLENPAALEYFIPMLRADFVLDETYDEQLKYKLNCPILALCGSQDREAEYDSILAWREYTTGDFYSRVYPGDHFYIKKHEDEVIARIGDLILRNNAKEYIKI
uniref:Putative thioesterase involved in non-ribosomal peptide biosynthesis n=1 Tax=Eubacterium cellulosolvens (strain ATCC 43171 / JCM 9499 / 6) TaxID=633697 RepID=I5AX04_EUBC6